MINIERVLMSLNCLAQHSLSITSTCPKFAPFNYNNRHFVRNLESESWYTLIIRQDIRLIKIIVISIKRALVFYIYRILTSKLILNCILAAYIFSSSINVND